MFPHNPPNKAVSLSEAHPASDDSGVRPLLHPQGAPAQLRPPPLPHGHPASPKALPGPQLPVSPSLLHGWLSDCSKRFIGSRKVEYWQLYFHPSQLHEVPVGLPRCCIPWAGGCVLYTVGPPSIRGMSETWIISSKRTRTHSDVPHSTDTWDSAISSRCRDLVVTQLGQDRPDLLPSASVQLGLPLGAHPRQCQRPPVLSLHLPS
ncbi:uncharacterized protein [Canis lupus baileyi]|uniref:uncharacterized protein n=1 Tax=Canis lupus baileyi TaxID=143281 RepID=UPI0015F19FD5|nr:uncharacterized protein LOC119869353 isoform X2 [Canis lupus familiaris]XP_038413493.1 uncharacterized protein LOC119869353 isoform X2 [Canis lupus familiaris]XP_038543155.1 uncharacterized protein LOC119869353 isoform X2 [Canis lupus familiaris]